MRKENEQVNNLFPPDWDIVEASDELNREVERLFPRMTPWRRLKRTVRYWWQRNTRGFDDSALWSFDLTVAGYLLPRLRRYEELYGPFEEEFPRWKEMMEGLQRVIYRDLTDDDNHCWEILASYIGKIYL